MTTTATKVRALDVIAVEYRASIYEARKAKDELFIGQMALEKASESANNRSFRLRQELHAAALGMTVEEERDRERVERGV